MKNNLQFYPTPKELATKMIDIMAYKNVLVKLELPALEPSAGNGDLLKWLAEDRRTEDYFGKRHRNDIDCVELDETRAATLRGNGYKVVHGDFLSFNPVTPYQTIIMNPPFKNGAAHLMKAISIAAPGAKICCLLNAETIKNPFSRERQLLIKTLERQAEYKCEFVSGAFDGVNIDVAIVYIQTQPANSKSISLEHFKRSAVRENKYAAPTEIQPADEIAALIARYRVEVKAAFALYDEIENYQRAVSFDGDKDKTFNVDLPCYGKLEVIHRINAKYWSKLFDCQSLQRLLTYDARNNLHYKISDMRHFEFSEYNILNLKIELCKQLTDSIDAAILKMWEDFTHKHSTDNPENIHYYNGWKTNKAFKCNGKVVIPLRTFDSYYGKVKFMANGACHYGTDYAITKLGDYEKALNYLDTGAVVSYNMAQILAEAARQNQNRAIDTHFFKVDCFKKGTVHLTFKSPELLKKFNLYCGRKFNWLPPSYGKKPYHDLTPEEKAVADSFEGADSYNDTFHNRNFYLASAQPLLLA